MAITSCSTCAHPASPRTFTARTPRSARSRPHARRTGNGCHSRRRGRRGLDPVHQPRRSHDTARQRLRRMASRVHAADAG
jgi:hypothetical protein